MTINNKFDFSDFYNHFNSVVGLEAPDPLMLTWLIGFAEGDGSFFITEQKKTLGKHKISFMISQHSNDVQVLIYIRNHLGFGRVEQSNKNMHRYIVTDIAHISCLLLLFNGNIVMPKFYDRFSAVIKKYNQRRANPTATKTKYLPEISLIRQLNQPALSNSWLSGRMPKVVFFVVIKKVQLVQEVAGKLYFQ